MLITRFFRKISILKQADIFLPFKTGEIKLQLLTVRKRVKIFSKENVAVEDISYDQ